MASNKLIQQYLEYDDLLSLHAYAKGEVEYGRFIPEFFRIEVDMSEAVERFHGLHDNSQTINKYMVETNSDCFEYVKFFQTYDHELFHFYQVLSMPAVFRWAETKFESLYFEMLIMLRNLDNGGTFSLGRYNKFSKMLKIQDSDCKIDQSNLNALHSNLENISIKYNYYVKNFSDFYDGISSLYIFESMAYFASLHLPKALFDKDVLGLKNQSKYTYCYEYFINGVSTYNQEKYAHYLTKVFIYICYFSFKVHKDPNDNNQKTDININTYTFIELCKIADRFFEIIEISDNFYRKQPIGSLRRKFYPNLANSEYLDYLDKKEIIELFSIFDLARHISELDLIKRFGYLIQNNTDEYKKDVLDNSKTFHALSHQAYNLAKNHQIDFNDIFLLAKILVIPNFFNNIANIYLDLKEDIDNFEENYDEDEFLSFVVKCKFLLNEQHDIFCCEKHGMRNNRKQILYCKEQGSLAYYLQNMFEKPAYELFKI